jgi:DegV family protein with EDD domain
MRSGYVAIVTDSAADVPPTMCETLNITVVPNIVIVGEESFEDDGNFSREEFYDNLPKMHPLPTTATPAIGKYQLTYETLLQAGASFVLSIHTSGSLSGILNAASTAAQDFAGRVRVFDSHFLTLGLGFQCIELAEAAKEGLTIDQVESLAKLNRQKARVIAMLDTLNYVHRSGRVSWTKARIGNLLRLKPFIQVKDGLVFSLGETRTREKGIIRLLQLIRNQGPMKRLAILHTSAENDAKRLLAELNPDIPTTPLIINITTVIGTHVGPNGLGFAGMVK